MSNKLGGDLDGNALKVLKELSGNPGVININCLEISNSGLDIASGASSNTYNINGVSELVVDYISVNNANSLTINSDIDMNGNSIDMNEGYITHCYEFGVYNEDFIIGSDGEMIWTDADLRLDSAPTGSGKKLLRLIADWTENRTHDTEYIFREDSIYKKDGNANPVNLIPHLYRYAITLSYNNEHYTIFVSSSELIDEEITNINEVYKYFAVGDMVAYGDYNDVISNFFGMYIDQSTHQFSGVVDNNGTLEFNDFQFNSNWVVYEINFIKQIF